MACPLWPRLWSWAGEVGVRHCHATARPCASAAPQVLCLSHPVAHPSTEQPAPDLGAAPAGLSGARLTPQPGQPFPLRGHVTNLLATSSGSHLRVKGHPSRDLSDQGWSGQPLAARSPPPLRRHMGLARRPRLLSAARVSPLGALPGPLTLPRPPGPRPLGHVVCVSLSPWLLVGAVSAWPAGWHSARTRRGCGGPQGARGPT